MYATLKMGDLCPHVEENTNKIEYYYCILYKN